MRHERVTAPAYVIKAIELPALNHIGDDYPRPQGVEWIDRGRDKRLRPTTIDMIMRTLFKSPASNSVERLHNSAGVRVTFRTWEDRHEFAAKFKRAVEQLATDTRVPDCNRAR